MEEQTQVYVFDSQEQYKENNFDIVQSKDQQTISKPTLNKQHVFTHPRSILKSQFHLYNPKQQEDSHQEQDLQYEEEEQEQQQDEYQHQNYEKKKYSESRNMDRIQQQLKIRSKTDFYQITSIDGNGNLKQILNITNSHQFISNSIHPNIVLECTMVKVKAGLFSYSWEVYSQNKFLMSVHKVSGLCAKYKIYSHKKQLDNNYVGRIQANFMGTEWFLYNTGTDPEKCRNLENVRKMMGSINYRSNLFRKKGLRKMEVYLPVPIQQSLKSFSCLQTMNVLKSIYQKQPDMVSRLTNKHPQYDEDSKCYRQDFRGKIKTTSVKNMIIIDEDTSKERLLFGKINEESYYFEARFPLSPLQAVAMGISSVEGKIGVE